MDVEQVFSYVGALLVGLTVLAHGLELIARVAVRLAFETATKDDDEAADKFLRATLRFSNGLAKVAGLLPAMRRR